MIRMSKHFPSVQDDDNVIISTVENHHAYILGYNAC